MQPPWNHYITPADEIICPKQEWVNEDFCRFLINLIFQGTQAKGTQIPKIPQLSEDTGPKRAFHLILGLFKRKQKKSSRLSSKVLEKEIFEK